MSPAAPPEAVAVDTVFAAPAHRATLLHEFVAVRVPVIFTSLSKVAFPVIRAPLEAVSLPELIVRPAPAVIRPDELMAPRHSTLEDTVHFPVIVESPVIRAPLEAVSLPELIVSPAPAVTNPEALTAPRTSMFEDIVSLPVTVESPVI